MLEAGIATAARDDAPAAPRTATVPRPLAAAAVAAWVGYTILLGVLYAHMPANPDSQIFDYIGWVANHGGRLYIDATEQNFPGMMWIHKLAIGLFGAHYWSHRLFDYLQMLAGCAVLAAALAPEVGLVRSLLVVPMYQTIYVTLGWWMGGERDIVVAPLLLGAGLAYRARTRGGGRGWLALFALALVCTSLVRPTYAAFAAFIVVADALTMRGRQRTLSQVVGDATIAASFCVVLIGAVLLGAKRAGTLGAFVECSLRFNAQIYSQSASLLKETRTLVATWRSWHWYTAFAIAGGWLWFRKGRDRFLWALVALVALTGITSAYIQLKGFGYHFGAIAVLFALFDTYFILWSLEGLRRGADRRRWALTAVVCAVALLGLGSKLRGQYWGEVQWLTGHRSEREMLASFGSGVGDTTYADLVDAANYARQTVPADGRVLAWTHAPHINFLAERRSPTRFVTVTMLISARPPFEAAGSWAHEVEEAFTHDPPALVFVPAAGDPDADALWNDPDPSPSVQIVRRELTTRYRHVADFGKLQAYRLTTAGRGT
jgi:hypothetical protein